MLGCQVRDGTWVLSHAPSSPFPMPEATPSLGACPFCEEPVPRPAVLIEYVVDSEKRLYAECPNCQEPVQPR